MTDDAPESIRAERERHQARIVRQTLSLRCASSPTLRRPGARCRRSRAARRSRPGGQRSPARWLPATVARQEATINLDGEGLQRDERLLAGLATTARLAIAAALESATDLGHNFLGCEHLVLGLAEQADGAAVELLRDLGIKPESIRRAIPPAVGAAALGYAHAQRLLAPTANDRLDAVDRRLDRFEQRLKARGL